MGKVVDRAHDRLTWVVSCFWFSNTERNRNPFIWGYLCVQVRSVDDVEPWKTIYVFWKWSSPSQCSSTHQALNNHTRLSGTITNAHVDVQSVAYKTPRCSLLKYNILWRDIQTLPLIKKAQPVFGKYKWVVFFLKNMFHILRSDFIVVS